MEKYEKYNFKRFLHIASVVLGFEGGFSDDPDDAGGKTNLGVTEGTLYEAYKRGIVAHYDVKKLTRKEALNIYFEMFWIPSHAYEIPDPLGFCVFDLAINGGPGRAIITLQQTVNGILEKQISEDGGFGPQTRTALEEILSKFIPGMQDWPTILSQVFLLERVEFYDDITDGEANTLKKREQEIRNRKFLRGWIRRVIKQRAW